MLMSSNETCSDRDVSDEKQHDEKRVTESVSDKRSPSLNGLETDLNTRTGNTKNGFVRVYSTLTMM